MRKKENRRIVVLLGAFVLLMLAYLLTQRWTTPVLIIHSPLDDWIPFCEWFVIPYVLWYAYWAGAILTFWLTDRDSLHKMMTMIVCGMAVATTLFVICPTGIDFRPEILPRDNLLVDIVRLLYAADQPENVCPSMHVLLALLVWIAVHHSPVLRQHRWVDPACGLMAILICLSTVFIKQHSVVDIVAALPLAGVLYWWVYRRKSKTDEVTI